MFWKSSDHIKHSLNRSTKTVGDMALKRRAHLIIEGLELKRNDKVLEVGCGNGYYLSLLNRLGMELTLVGIDNDKMALSDAKKFIWERGVKLIFSAAEKLPFRDDSFDKVIMSEVIEHVQDEKKSLKEIYRVLKKGGILTLTTPNINYPFFWDPINWILQHVFNTHIRSGFWAGIWNQHDRMYKREQIENLVKEAGFSINGSETLTSWCLPFNHYFVNFVAKLFYSNKLPQSLSKGINKFKNNQQSLFVNVAFRLINLFDRLNDYFPQKSGVSIFVKSRK